MTVSKSHNHLASERSPYLQQHADNPVDWYPWGEAALLKAWSEDKPIIVSIGYAACHWCHVMEKESFSNQAIADFMNQKFVCIKIDREERPDLDQIYMTAIQMIHHHGGWPLNAFTLPDGKPFYGGTYFKPEQWLSLLKQIAELYRADKNSILKQAEEISQGVALSGLIRLAPFDNARNRDKIKDLYSKLSPTLDPVFGGSDGAPKFPLPTQSAFLLRYAIFSKEEDAKKQLELALGKMSLGGIYDHVGGGFSRYTVDDAWHIPHFEKMLYDNAQLISLYAEAYRWTKNPGYREIIEQSIAHLEKTFLLQGSGFCSSLDADSEGEEGRYYTWTKEEVQKLLGARAERFIKAYQIDGKAHWENGKYILWKCNDLTSLANEEGMSLGDLEEDLARSREILLQVRNLRIPPALDDKVLASWNAMMIIAYLDAYYALGHENYRNEAVRLAQFMLDHMKQADGTMFRVWKDGHAYTPGCLEDYAWMIGALMKLYQATFIEDWINEANELAIFTIRHFYDPKTAMFWLSSEDVDVPVSRKMETYDHVIPSSNAVMARNLYHLGYLLEDERYKKLALQSMSNMTEAMLRQPSAYLFWGILYMEMTLGLESVVITGSKALHFQWEMEEVFDPWRLIAGSEENADLRHIVTKFVDNETLIYICTKDQCLEPVHKVSKALAMIADLRQQDSR